MGINVNDEWKSLFKSICFIGATVIINMLGGFITRSVDSIIFIDLIGTAILSFMYGPIYGAVTGLISNLASEYLLGLDLFFTFALVQVFCALVWGAVPRVLDGRWYLDVFRPDKKQLNSSKGYGYKELIMSVMFLSLLSHSMASVVVGVLVHLNAGEIKCGFEEFEAVHKGAINICQMSSLLFGETGYKFDGIWYKVAAGAFILRWADHLIAVSVALIVISSFFPEKRFKMVSVMGSISVVQKPFHGKIFLLICIMMLAYRISHIWDNYDTTEIYVEIFMNIVFVIGLILFWMKKKLDMMGCEKFEIKESIYMERNANVEKVFDDLLKVSVVIAVCSFLYINNECSQVKINNELKLCDAEISDEHLRGIMGITFLIAAIRYITLIIVRSFHRE